ncbi:hypothetical protein D3C81_2012080 [compost metagenome]
MPIDAGTGTHDGVIGAMLKDGDVAVGEGQYRAFRVGCQQHVAAAAQHQQRTVADDGG